MWWGCCCLLFFVLSQSTQVGATYTSPSTSKCVGPWHASSTTTWVVALRCVEAKGTAVAAFIRWYAQSRQTQTRNSTTRQRWWGRRSFAVMVIVHLWLSRIIRKQEKELMMTMIVCRVKLVIDSWRDALCCKSLSTWWIKDQGSEMTQDQQQRIRGEEKRTHIGIPPRMASPEVEDSLASVTAMNK